MSADLDLELLISVASGLGRLVQDKAGKQVYAKDKDCLACLKDLQRFLKRDDPETRDVFNQLGQYNIVRNDLVPLLITYPSDAELVFNALKVVTYLTMPIDQTSDNQIQQAVYMQQAKSALLSKDALAVIAGLVTEPLSRHPEMTENDCMIVQLMLTFVRNLLCIPDAESSNTSAGAHKTKMQEELLGNLFKNHVMELLLIMAQHADSRDDTFEPLLLLEIFSKVFEGVEPAALLSAQSLAEIDLASKSSREQNRDNSSGGSLLKKLLSQDKSARKSASALQGRHSRLSALFGRTQNGRQVAVAPKVSAVAGKAMTTSNKAKAAPRFELNRPLGPRTAAHLRTYADQFLETSYSALMAQLMVKMDALNGYEKDRAPDVMRFMQLIGFCSSYVRQKEEVKHKQQKDEAKRSKSDYERPSSSPFQVLSSTLDYHACHFALKTWLQQMDEPVRSPNKDWDLQGASWICMQELLQTLDLAMAAGSDTDVSAADSIFRALLHSDSEESGLLNQAVRQMRTFNHQMQKRSVAVATVQVMDVVISQLERLTAGNFVVARKRSHKGKKKTQQAAEEADGQDTADQEAGEADGEADPPFTEREQAPMDELLGEADDISDEEQQQANVRIVELDNAALNRRLVTKVVTPAVVHFYVWVLQGYATNPKKANDAIISMLARIADPEQLNAEPMLFQLSVLRVFHKIMSDKALYKDKNSYNILNFCKLVTRRLFSRMMPEERQTTESFKAVTEVDDTDKDERAVWEAEWEKTRASYKAKAEKEAGAMMFVELLFWKDRASAKEIQECYKLDLLLDQEYRSAVRTRWNEEIPEKEDGPPLDPEQVQEMRALWADYRNRKNYAELIAEAYGGEMSKQQANTLLKRAGIVCTDFTEEQAMQLELLWDEYSGSDQALDKCTRSLEVFPMHKVAAKLREMGHNVSIRAPKKPQAANKELSPEQRIRIRELIQQHGNNKDLPKIIKSSISEIQSQQEAKKALKKMDIALVPLDLDEVDALVGSYEKLAQEEKKAARDGVSGRKFAALLASEADCNKDAAFKTLVQLGLVGRQPRASWMTDSKVETMKTSFKEHSMKGMTTDDIVQLMSSDIAVDGHRVRRALETLGLIYRSSSAEMTQAVEEKLRALHEEHQTCTPAQFWKQMISGLDKMYTKGEVSKMLKSVSLAPPTRSKGGESVSGREDSASEQSDSDSVQAPNSEKASKALAKLQRAEGGDVAKAGISWLSSRLRSILADWNERSYSAEYELEANTAEQETLLKSPHFNRLLRALRAKKDSNLNLWAFQGVNGSMWMQGVLDALLSAEKNMEQHQQTFESQQAAGNDDRHDASDEGGQKSADGGSTSGEESNDSGESDADSHPKKTSKPLETSGRPRGGSSGPTKMADWSESDSDVDDSSNPVRSLLLATVAEPSTEPQDTAEDSLGVDTRDTQDGGSMQQPVIQTGKRAKRMKLMADWESDEEGEAEAGQLPDDLLDVPSEDVLAPAPSQDVLAAAASPGGHVAKKRSQDKENNGLGDSIPVQVTHKRARLQRRTEVDLPTAEGVPGLELDSDLEDI